MRRHWQTSQEPSVRGRSVDCEPVMRLHSRHSSLMFRSCVSQLRKSHPHTSMNFRGRRAVAIGAIQLHDWPGWAATNGFICTV